MRHGNKFRIGQFLFASFLLTLVAPGALAQQEQNTSQNNEATAEEPPDEGSAKNVKQDTEKAAKESAGDADNEVLEVIEFKQIPADDFMNAARVAGVIDYGLSRQREQPLYIAHKRGTKICFVRGPQKRVSEVQALAKKLDLARDKMPESLKFKNGMYARMIPRDQLNEIQGILRILNFDASSLELGDTSYLVFSKTKQNVQEQIDQVLKTLNEINNQATAKKDRSNPPADKTAKAPQDADDDQQSSPDSDRS